jgi:hypothetical protein
MMAARKELAGLTFNRWTVLEYKGNRKWLCRCSCGTEKLVASGQLQNGQSKSCGCLKNERLIDLTGQKFAELTVIEYVGSSKWKVLCSCGVIKITTGQNLREGKIVSCGCKKDLIGQIFGEWTVISRGRSDIIKKGDEITGSVVYWNCKCSCGVEREVTTSSLKSGASQSCGHIAAQRHHSTHVGSVFGFLTVLETYHPGGDNIARAKCQCICGNQTNVSIQGLLGGKVKSCGCLRREASRQRLTALKSRHEMEIDAKGRYTGWKPKT